jgi:protein-arginine kinase activator protein McsA
MLDKVIKGTNECYVCGDTIEWESNRVQSIGNFAVHKIPDVEADITACGKNENGTVKFEILCKCPNCRISNKFYKDVEI